MFPSKFLQFPSILTHFHAANEKIQNGGRDLAISRGLVWVNPPDPHHASFKLKSSYSKSLNSRTLRNKRALEKIASSQNDRTPIKLYANCNNSKDSGIALAAFKSKYLLLQPILVITWSVGHVASMPYSTVCSTTFTDLCRNEVQ